MINLERVTPEKAMEWLGKNSANRRPRRQIVSQYAEDMRNGNWTRCVVPISFYEDGELADGQHRLRAVIASGTTQSFFVVRELSRADGLNIDTGLARTMVDAGRISGLDDGLTNEMVATARAVQFGRTNRGVALSNADRLVLLSRHREPVEWVCANGPRGMFLRNALTLAAGVRAIYGGESRVALGRFFEVLTNGMAVGEAEHAAVAARNFLLDGGNVLLHNSNWTDTSKRVQNMMHAFFRGRALTRVMPMSYEHYPLPKLDQPPHRAESKAARELIAQNVRLSGRG